MAQKTLLTCDLHDEEVIGAETVSFSVSGNAYEIDLCDEHVTQMNDAFAPFIGAARKGGRGAPVAAQRKSNGSNGRATAKAAAGGDKGKVSEVREWARANGHQVNDRGRIAQSVLDAYEAAH